MPAPAHGQRVEEKKTPGSRKVGESFPPGSLTPFEIQQLERLRTRLGDLGGKRVLEPSCGGGFLTEHLSQWVEPRGEVVACDSSSLVLQRCRERLAGRANVRVSMSRGEEAAFPLAAFDVVVCLRALPQGSQRRALFSHFARWLKPGGLLHLAYWHEQHPKSRATVSGMAAAHALAQSASAGSPHGLPPAGELAVELVRDSFAVESWIDTAEEFYLSARRR